MTSSVKFLGSKTNPTNSTDQFDEDVIRMALASIDGHTSSELRKSSSSTAPVNLENLSAVLDLIGSTGQEHSSSGDQGAIASLKIGRYEVLRERGRGGFGVVLHAFDTLLEREVALKIPKPERLLAGQALDAMVREARVVAKLSHPGIVRVYEVRRLGPVWCIAADYCDGPTLAEWLDSRGKPLSPRMAAQVLAAVADAVHYAHMRGVLHLDLKPANILLREGEKEALHPVVTDFGLAQGDTGSIGGFHRIGGTLMYMAPEQKAQEVERIGVATDVYALGVILSELLGISPPTDDENSDADSFTKAVSRAPAAIPRDLLAICNHCLADDPNDRYQSVHDLASDLRHYLKGWSVTARPLSWPQKVGYFCRRKPLASVATVALLMTLLASSIALAVAWRKAESHLASLRISERQQRESARWIESSLLNLAWITQEAKLRIPHDDDETGLAIPGMKEFFDNVREWAESGDNATQSTAGLLAAINSLSLVDGIGDVDDEAFAKTFHDGLSAWLALIHREPNVERWHKALALHLFTYKLRQGDNQWLSWYSSTIGIDDLTRRKVERPYALLLIDYATTRLRQQDYATKYKMLGSAIEILDDEQSLFSLDRNQRLHWLITAHQQAATTAVQLSQPKIAESHFATLSRLVSDAPPPANCDARSAASVADVLVKQWRRKQQSSRNDALELLQRAISYGQRAMEVQPHNPTYVNALSRQHRFIGTVYRDRDQMEACLKSFNIAMSVLERGLASSNNDRTILLERGRLAALIAEEHLLLQEPLVARKYFERSVEDFKAASLMHGDTRGTWFVAAYSLQSLAKLYVRENRLEESLAAYQRSIELMTALQSFRKHSRAEALIKRGQQEIEKLTQAGQSASSP